MRKFSERDIPREVKRFYKTFEQISRRHNDVTVFDDFLTVFISRWTREKDFHDEWEYAKKKYDEKELMLFSDLGKIYIQDFSELIDSGTYQWFDFFGTLYEFISSYSKASALGQFFTPASLVDMLVKMQGIENGATVNDPACGSSRMLIAAHANNPTIFVFGEDLDLMCCKMSIINCFMHGCNAQIVWRNSLDFNDYKKGWKILFPEIKVLKKEDSFTWNVSQRILSELKEQNKTEEKKEEIFKPQLELFGT